MGMGGEGGGSIMGVGVVRIHACSRTMRLTVCILKLEI